MGKKKIRKSKSIRNKSKRFQQQNPKFVESLGLPEEVIKNNKKFLSIVLDKIEKKEVNRDLLTTYERFPFTSYQVVPRFRILLRKETAVILPQVIISELEKTRIESTNDSFLSFSTSEPVPKNLLLSTNPLPYEASWPIELKPYFIALSSTYRLRTNFTYHLSSFSSNNSIFLNPFNVVTFLSMGKESLRSLSKTIENKSYINIIVIFVYGASWGGRSREKTQFNLFSEWFHCQNVDNRVRFFILNYERESFTLPLILFFNHSFFYFHFYSLSFINFVRDLVGIQKNEKSIKIQNDPIKEPLCKLQYMQMLAVPLIRKYSCGLFIVPQDYQELDYESTTYFGDQPVSFRSFNDFFCKFVGGSISLLFQGSEISRADKVLGLIELNWFQFNSSCYMNWNFFDYYQFENNINPALNMCGECWKCQIDLKMIKENFNLSRTVRLYK